MPRDGRQETARGDACLGLRQTPEVARGALREGIRDPRVRRNSVRLGREVAEVSAQPGPDASNRDRTTVPIPGRPQALELHHGPLEESRGDEPTLSPTELGTNTAW